MLKRLVMTVLVAVTLSACGTVVAPTPGAETAPEATAEQTQEEASEPGSELVDPNDLEIGDCWSPVGFNVDLTAGPELAPGIERVPCESTHMAEVYAVFDVEGEEYPGDDAIINEVRLGCLPGFEEYVGTAYEDSVLDINALYPSRKTWTRGHDRTIICSIIDMYGEPLTGSMEGSER